jgi:DNA-binding XRE family transcriptional regulator
MMDKKKIRELEAKGFKVGDVAEFLELTVEEKRLVEMRLAFARKMREVRLRRHMTQVEVAKRIKSSQSRVAKIEAGDRSVTFDLLVKALVSLGVSNEEMAEAITQ